MFVQNCTFSAMTLGRKYPHNMLLLRYEDLCFDPYGTVDKLLIFLAHQPKDILNILELVDQYVQSHTGKTRSGQIIEISQKIHDDPMGTVKNSALKALEWKTNIRESLLLEIEEKCENPIKELGYAIGAQKKDQTLIKSAIEVWPFSGVTNGIHHGLHYGS